jgi:hypothetical protein
MRYFLLSLALISSLYGDDLEDLMSGFEDEPTQKASKVDLKTQMTDVSDVEMDEDELLSGFDEDETKEESEEKETLLPKGFEGRFTESLSYGICDDSPHDGLNSVKSLLFLEYNGEIFDNFRVKINGNLYYDAAYGLKGRDKFSKEELDELESEAEIFDAFIEGSLSKNADIKLGRQVVVWGKSDTIRVTDILNPLDNRRPAMVDIEDLRLPVAMVKFDYYYKNFRVTPIAILEQRFDKNPPFKGAFYPSNERVPYRKEPSDATFALNIAGEFKGFDADFYYANIYQRDEMTMPLSTFEKIDMFGGAVNFVKGSWLFKSEVAYLKDLRFLQLPNSLYDRVDVLVGFEYNGIADTTISYDIADRHFLDSNPLLKEDSWINAFRVKSDFLNSTLSANFLISLYGKELDEGGFWRSWAEYDLSDGVSVSVGVVDYLSGIKLFDEIDDNDMIFIDYSYSF